MVWRLGFRSELGIIDYFNDSEKTSPNNRQILRLRKKRTGSARWILGFQIPTSDMLEFHTLSGSQVNFNVWFPLYIPEFWTRNHQIGINLIVNSNSEIVILKNEKFAPGLLLYQTLSELLLRWVASLWPSLDHKSFWRSKCPTWAHYELSLELAEQKNWILDMVNCSNDKFSWNWRLFFWNSNWSRNFVAPLQTFPQLCVRVYHASMHSLDMDHTFRGDQNQKSSHGGKSKFGVRPSNLWKTVQKKPWNLIPNFQNAISL